MHQILVVDADPANTRLLRFLLLDDGHEVTTTTSAHQALKQLEQDPPELVILDTQLPDMPGLELCRLIRSRSNTPIMILSARVEVKDKVAGLQAGADDYLARPFDPHELTARIWALLRRSAQLANSESSLRNADLHLDPSTNQVTLTRTGETLELTPIETRLLRFMISHPGRTLTRDALAIKVWGYEYDARSNQLDVYVSRLRNKLEENPRQPQLIQTVPSVGYRFQPTATGATPARPKKKRQTDGE